MNNATTKSIRAIASTMIRQFLLPFIMIGAGMLIVLFVIVALLAINYSSWWLISLFILIPISLLFTILVSAVWFIYKKIRPLMSARQKQAVNQFADRVTDYSELIGTPRFIIAFRVVRDVARQRPRKYIDNLLDSSGDLKRDFEAVRRSFEA